MMFLLYPSLLSQMLGILNCREIHGSYYVVADLSVPCYTPTHRAYQVLASLGIVMYVLGIPAGFLFLMRTRHIPKLAQHKQEAQILHNVLLHATGKVPGVIQFLDNQPDASHIFTQAPTRLLRAVLQFVKGSHEAGMHEAPHASLENAGMPLDGNTDNPSSENEELLEGERTALRKELLRWAESQALTIRHLTDIPKIGWEAHRGVPPEALTSYQQKEQHACAEIGFLFKMYHTETWWYEILDLIRKLVLTGGISFLEKGSATQIALAIAFSFVMLSINLTLKPVFDTQINQISNIALLEILVTLYVGLLLKFQIVDESSADSASFTALVMFLNTFIFLYPGVCMLFGRKNMWDVNIRQRSSLHISKPTKPSFKEKMLRKIGLFQDSKQVDPTDAHAPKSQVAWTTGRNDSGGGELSSARDDMTASKPPTTPQYRAESSHSNEVRPPSEAACEWCSRKIVKTPLTAAIWFRRSICVLDPRLQM